MSNHYNMDRITPEMIEKKKLEAANENKKELRRAQAMRAVAENMDGAYITKRVEEKILSLIPDAERVFMYQPSYGDYVELSVSYPDTRNYGDGVSFRLCDTSNRRLNGKELLESAAKIEAKQEKNQRILEHLDEIAAAYNDLADQYARIYPALYDFFYDDVPYADYDLHRKYKEDDPLSFLAPAPAAENVVPLQPVEIPRYTLEEFMALAANE